MNDVYDRLVKMLMDVMGMEEDEIQPHHTFNELEVDSLGLVELVLVVQKEFGVEIADDEVSPDFTIAQTAELIVGKGVKV
ncbi:acyl carrier protein [Lentzea sp. NPDC042327]|uniref:acyl carrier protein n=1 Tax=Lentzea sp. NPDC042327 TaxID=3154801 RepID=UPI0033EDFA54